MNHAFQFFITAHLLIATACHGMDDIKKQTDSNLVKPLMEITAVQKPRFAEFIDNHTIVIRGIEGCATVDLTKDKTIKEIITPSQPLSYGKNLTLHPNKELIALFANSKESKKIGIYNLTTGKEVWIMHEENNISSCAFHPQEPIIFVSSGFFSSSVIKSYNYITGDTDFENDTQWNNSLNTFKKIMCHPTKPILCVTHNNSGLSLHSLDNSFEKISIKLPDINHSTCQYSSDGTIAIGDSHDNLRLLHFLESKTKQYKINENNLISYPSNEFFIQPIDIKFHPSSKVLAILSRRYGVISYWRTKTRRLIAQSFIEKQKTECPYYITFSPNGKNILAMLENRCLIFPVPFKVYYVTNAQPELSHLLFVLNNYQHEDSQLPNDQLPADIIGHLIHTSFETYKS